MIGTCKVVSSTKDEREVFARTVGSEYSLFPYLRSRVGASVGRITQYLTPTCCLRATSTSRPLVRTFAQHCQCSSFYARNYHDLGWLQRNALELTQRRAAWLAKWSKQTADAQVIHVRSFEEALGRVVFLASALQLIRPFLSPLKSFSCSGPRGGVRPVPTYVSFILHFLGRSAEKEAHTVSAAEMSRWHPGTACSVAAWQGVARVSLHGSRVTLSSA